MENNLIKFCYINTADENNGGKLELLDRYIVTEKPKTLGIADSGSNTAFILI